MLMMVKDTLQSSRSLADTVLICDVFNTRIWLSSYDSFASLPNLYQRLFQGYNERIGIEKSVIHVWRYGITRYFLCQAGILR